MEGTGLPGWQRPPSPHPPPTYGEPQGASRGLHSTHTRQSQGASRGLHSTRTRQPQGARRGLHSTRTRQPQGASALRLLEFRVYRPKFDSSVVNFHVPFTVSQLLKRMTEPADCCEQTTHFEHF